jgi:hypothetical protein
MREQSLYNLFASKIVLLDYTIEPVYLNLKHDIAELKLDLEEQNILIEEVARLWDEVVTHTPWNEIDEDNDLLPTKNQMIDLARAEKQIENYENNIGE